MKDKGQLFKDGRVKGSQYTAASVEVLEGLDPERRRPGMYMDTSRPNHLAQEVIDNSTDEAIPVMPAASMWCYLKTAQSRSQTTDGECRWTTHLSEMISGVEVIMTRLYAGAKFSNKDYH